MKPDNSPPAFNDRGNAHSRKRRIGQGCRRLQRGNPAESPISFIASTTAPKLYAEKGEYELALADANEALRLGPKLAYPHATLSRAYLGKGDVQGALSEADQSVALNPAYMGGLVALGEAEVKKGDVRKALERF